VSVSKGFSLLLGPHAVQVLNISIFIPFDIWAFVFVIWGLLH